MEVTLRSNNGSSAWTIDLVRPVDYAHDLGFEASISIRAQHWDGVHTHPVSVSLEGLWLRAHDLRGLCDRILAWTSLPLDQLIPTRLDGSFELARLPGQRLAVVFGARPDTIDERHPVVTVMIAAGRLCSEFPFVADQTCLALFAADLARHLRDRLPS